jgi:glycine betaine/proline transport system substrate-binding protein
MASERQGGSKAAFGISRRTVLQGTAAGLAIGGFAAQSAAQKRPMVYAYANWSDDLAITYIGAQLIEEKFGYKVTPLQAEVAVIYASLQSGKADVYSAAYMQGLGPMKGVYKGGQSDYVKKSADAIEVVGVSEGPMTQGFAVPDYATIDSIEELNGSASKFDNKIIGIDPGSGLMQSADKAVKDYGLKLTLVAGSEAAMEAAFQRAYQRQEWIVVTTWAPLPMWAQYKMKYLKDPKKLMMEEPYYDFHVVRKDFKTNFPDAYGFFEKYHIPNEEEAKVMGWIDGGSSPTDAAKKWIAENQGKGMIEKWFA